MLSKPNKFKKFKIPRIRYKKKKKKKRLFVSLSQWPNWQFPQSVIRLYNVWILTLFTSYLSEFLHQSHLSSWPNTSVTLCPSHKIGMCTLLFCATLSISFSLMLGFWTFWDLTNLPVLASGHPFRALSSLLSISLCLIYSMRDQATTDVLLHFSFQS